LMAHPGPNNLTLFQISPGLFKQLTFYSYCVYFHTSFILVQYLAELIYL
jgi:hypothetical protein